MRTLDLFVPSWFTKGMATGMEENELKTLIKDNLISAYSSAQRMPPENGALVEKIDDLYSLYEEALQDYRVE